MKIWMPLFLLLSCSNALAGDLYLVCSQVLNEDGDEEFLLNRTVENSRIEGDFFSTIAQDLLFRVTFDPASRKLTAKVKSMTGRTYVMKMTKTLKPGRPVELSEHVYCVLAD